VGKSALSECFRQGMNSSRSRQCEQHDVTTHRTQLRRPLSASLSPSTAAMSKSHEEDETVGDSIIRVAAVQELSIGWVVVVLLSVITKQRVI